MNSQWIRLKQLDRQLLALKNQEALLMPKQGWVRTLRKTLGMTIKQLAKRLEVNPSRVVKIETAELEGTITLHTLQSVADALGCELVCSFIPKSSLETVIRDRAKTLAAEQVKRTSHTMDLEAQSVGKLWLKEQQDFVADELLRHSWKDLWDE